MRKIWLALAFLGFLSVQAHAQWKPVEGKIKTRWAEQVNPDNVLPEYPRPIMERAEWKNLNGLWEYAIIEKGSHTPTSFDGCRESAKEWESRRNWFIAVLLMFLLLGKEKKFFCTSEPLTGKPMFG